MNTNSISTVKAFRLTGTFTFALAILTVLTSVLAYLPDNPDFSIFTTYLSDIGDTPGWPQILFNSGTILASLSCWCFGYAAFMITVNPLKSRS